MNSASGTCRFLGRSVYFHSWKQYDLRGDEKKMTDYSRQAGQQLAELLRTGSK